MRLDAVLGQAVEQSADDAGVLHRPRRDVDRHPRDDLGRGGVAEPVRHLRDRRADDPEVELDDEARVLGDVDEGVGRQQAVTDGIERPDERLDADDPAVLEADDRLVLQRQAILLERGAQEHLGVVPSASPRAQCVVVHDVAVAAGVLGPVQGEVGLAEQLVGRHVPARGGRHAQARRADEDLP
jgi:hypothetical protein